MYTEHSSNPKTCRPCKREFETPIIAEYSPAALTPDHCHNEFHFSLLGSMSSILVSHPTLQTPVADRAQVLETLLNNEPCGLDEQPWQDALRRSIVVDRELDSRSPKIMSFWMIQARVPRLFQRVGHVIGHPSEKDVDRIRECVYDLIHETNQWKNMWHETLEADMHGPGVGVKEKRIAVKTVMAYLAFSILARRLLVATRPCIELENEQSLQHDAAIVVATYEELNKHGRSPFTLSIFSLQVAESVLATHADWSATILMSDFEDTVCSDDYKLWCALFGRTA